MSLATGLHYSGPYTMPHVSSLPDLLARPELLELLAELRRAATGTRPEEALVRLLAARTGGRAEVYASWGPLVAGAGEPPAGVSPQSLRLTHGRRHVGRLELWLPPEWAALGPLAAEYALLARLQTAAAGAARRRVGERTLDALLSGVSDPATLGPDAYAVAVAGLGPAVGRGAGARAAQAHALDVLAGAGEGYFAERVGQGLCTVRGDQAVWLWPARDLLREAEELYEALKASTGPSVRLGVSGLHRRTAPVQALQEAQQALSSLAGRPGHQIFQQMDPLYALLTQGRLTPLRRQVQALLADLDDGGRTESTLRAYLAHQGTLAELAEQQNVHVNTLRYRLRRAEQALDGSLSDPALLARLYLAFSPTGDP